MPDSKLTKCIESSATFLKLINTSKEERKKEIFEESPYFTLNDHHMQENEKLKQKKEKCTKQCNHKYEICLLEMI